jgi:hypothetical protein
MVANVCLSLASVAWTEVFVESETFFAPS